jgi:hypothetical protein
MSKQKRDCLSLMLLSRKVRLLTLSFHNLALRSTKSRRVARLLRRPLLALVLPRQEGEESRAALSEVDCRRRGVTKDSVQRHTQNTEDTTQATGHCSIRGTRPGSLLLNQRVRRKESLHWTPDNFDLLEKLVGHDIGLQLPHGTSLESQLERRDDQYYVFENKY